MSGGRSTAMSLLESIDLFTESYIENLPEEVQVELDVELEKRQNPSLVRLDQIPEGRQDP